MNAFENKIRNRSKLNKHLCSFYNDGLIPELGYHLKTKAIKTTKYENPKTYEQVSSFVEKSYINNKNKIAIDKYIDESRKEVLALTEASPNEKFDKIERNLDNKLNVYSDEFGVTLKKALKEVEEKTVFMQLVYNLTIAKVEEDFSRLGLPAEYKLNIKDESTKTSKEKTKSV